MTLLYDVDRGVELNLDDAAESGALYDGEMLQVTPYDPDWPDRFCRLRDKIWPLVADLAVEIDHVGSTAVPGLAAKPVIDMDVVIRSRGDLPAVVMRLGTLGYEHCGDLGIPDRDAFTAPTDLPAHHLYVCPAGCVALRNHIALRDHLRSHPSDAAAYAALKIKLAAQFPHDRDRYVEGKSDLIRSILVRYGVSVG